MRYEVVWGENYIPITKIFESEIEAHKFAENKGHCKIIEICEHPADKIKILKGEVCYTENNPQHLFILNSPEISYNFECICLICGEKIIVN